MKRLTLLLYLLALGSCGNRPSAARSIQEAAPEPSLSAKRPGTSPAELLVSPDTRSPNPENEQFGLASLTQPCGELDARLNRVASWLALRGSVGGYSHDIEELTFALRVVGAPYVWPSAWSRWSPVTESDEQIALGLTRWLGTLEQGELRRCGLARVEGPGGHLVVAVASMAPADLVVPLPIQARIGQWLEFVARLRVEATDAKVILLGPTGEPMVVPTEQRGSLVRARFAAASPGKWLVQLLASGETGPRPMLEAVLFVDVTPTSVYNSDRVPGEGSPPGARGTDEVLDQLVNATREETGRPPMRRDPVLDRLAKEHAVSMRDARRIGHDVGNGPTHERLAAAGFHARLAGENVAHAADALRAHRSLWASPSHRSNLLHRGFARWGLGFALDEDGSVWICELFASQN